MFANYNYKITSISKNIEEKMIKGNSHNYACPVTLKDLRYINLEHIDFKGNTKIGELIVHKNVASDIVKIFEYLYNIKYPIEKMKLVSNYKANDFSSIEDNNTSAYNCRFIENTTKWSKHAYGKAIDINPIQNPYISKSGEISHEKSLKYRKRVVPNDISYSSKAILLKNDEVVRIFQKYGWKWGGIWKSIKDYQHFEKRQ